MHTGVMAMSSLDLRSRVVIGAAVATAIALGFWSAAQSQISNPGVQQSGAVTAGHGVKWGPGVGQISDSGGAIPATFVSSWNARTGAVLPAANDYNFNQLAGVLACAQMPTAGLSGDLSTPANSCVTTFATVNANVGSFGSGTQVVAFTVNAKGLITAAANTTIAPPFTAITGQLACAQMPAAGLSGDLTTPSGSCVTTFATVNANVGTFGSATNCPTLTVNAKGLVTAASAATCTPAFSSITGSVALTQMAAQAANTVVANFTAGSAAPVAFVMPSCAADGAHALTYTNGTGIVCTVVTGGTIGGSTGSTDNAALRADGTGGATLQASALIIADTTGSLSRSGGGGIPVEGTNTNDSAAAGYKGEVISSNIASASAVSLTTATTANVTSVSLTAGDWLVCGSTYFVTNAATVVSVVAAGISITSATFPTTPSTSIGYGQWLGSSTGVAPATPSGCFRQILSGTTTVYLVMNATFITNTLAVYGTLQAWRTR